MRAVATALVLALTWSPAPIEAQAKKLEYVSCGMMVGNKAEPKSAELKELRDFICKAMEAEDQRIAKILKEEEDRGRHPLIRVATLVPFGDWDYYYVRGDTLSWQPNPGQQFAPVVVPEGFVSDLASVPRLLWSFKRPEGRHAYAAVIHDYLYWTQTRTRQEADDIFRIALEDSKVDANTVLAMYEVVRKAGQSAWDNNAKRKKMGECRILKEEPTNFTTSWREWRKNPKVFQEPNCIAN